MSIAAIVVLYNPEDIIKNIDSIQKQVDFCILIDNSDAGFLSLPENDKIIYKHLGGNYGIAKAQNVGLEKARKLGCQFVIFFDQDSESPNDLVSNLHKSYLNLESLNFKVGLVGPRAFSKETGSIYYHRDRDHQSVISSINNSYTPVEYTLSSGSLSRISVFEQIGYFKEELFIDSVDHEICWRMASFGFSVFIDETTKLPHMLGYKQIRFLGVNVNIPSPIRHYYVFRNWILLLSFDYVPLKFKISTLIKIIPKAVFFSCVVKPRINRFKYICKGVLDGLNGKDGPIDK